MMSSGVIGPYKDYILNFPLIQQDPKKRKEFNQIYPTVWDFMHLKDSSSKEEKDKAALRAMLSLRHAEDSGPPQWLIDAAGA